jgi:hypothetical protein
VQKHNPHNVIAVLHGRRWMVVMERRQCHEYCHQLYIIIHRILLGNLWELPPKKSMNHILVMNQALTDSFAMHCSQRGLICSLSGSI